MAVQSGFLTGNAGMRKLRAALAARPVYRTTLALVLTAIVLILFVDRPVALFLGHHQNSDIAGFFHALTQAGKGTVYIVGSALFWLGFRWLSKQDLAEESRRRFARTSRTTSGRWVIRERAREVRRIWPPPSPCDPSIVTLRSFMTGYPFTQSTCRRVWTISTRSAWAAITASIGL